MEIKIERLRIEGMTCSGCEKRIESSLSNIEGVESVKASTARSEAEIAYDPVLTDPSRFRKKIEELGYTIANKPADKKRPFSGVAQILGFAIIVFALYYIVQNTVGFSFIPQINQNMGFGILFVVGLITSLHCIAMCGGINLSQSVKEKTASDISKTSGVLPSLLYNSGRIVSYTVIGGVIGGVGSIFSFSPMAKGAIAIIAGLFMIIMGLNMLKAFSFLQHFNIRFPKFIQDRLNRTTAKGGKYGPFVVGLLNGLMPCGPLQAMQVYALGTGSVLNGALSMFFFSLGTAPLMFAFGAAGTLLSKKFTRTVFKFGGVLVMVLGFFMLNNGFGMTGRNILPVMKYGKAAEGTNTVSMTSNVQIINIEVLPNSFAPIRVVKGVPVKWNLHVKPGNLNGCNNAIVVPGLGIQKKLEPGDNIIEFTPTETGIIPYSCWMGMIRSQIEVVDPNRSAADNSAPKTVKSPILRGGCCKRY